MASGIGLSLDTSFLQSLEKADNKIKDLTDKTNALSRATVQAFQQMAKSGVVPYIEQLNRQKKALEEIGKIKGTSPFLTKMQADAKVAVDEINNLIKALEKTKAYKGEMSGKTAISFANSVLGQRGEAKSIDNMKLAISQLEAAQNRLNLNTKTGQKNYEKIGETIKKVKAELDKATGANKELTEESKKTSDAVGRIGRNISIAFAVNAIRTFTKQLVDVRGEFELQHRSLQVLLQDVDEANALWEKTTALAVKSPYRVKELVTYTKQLAAYRVESEKLYDTTRMLADVSSGLGVDMNRLILAFGQVKAANFLRGTELRQFSEAGVNLLEELSKRFTQLEGRAVSVGDVFERVSKRMVSFADVEAVFQTITSEGGVFYQMQEKQSETLRGMWMNLMDSIDLALNDIGRNGSDILKGAVKLTKEIVDNWRKLVPIIAGAGTTLFAYFSVASLTAIGKAVGALVNPWALVAGAVAGLTVGIISAIKAQRELTAEINRIDTEVRGQLEDSTALYMKLTKAINDVTSSEKERNKALDQLKAKFADILPDQMLELEYIQGIADNYSEATDAMINYYTAKSREQKKDKVESHYAEEIEGTDIPELITATRTAINRLGAQGIVSSDMQLALLGSIKYALNAVTEKVKGGEISSEYNSVRNAIFAELEKYSGYKGSLFDDLLNINTALFDEQVKDISTTLSGLKRDLENIPQFSFGSYAKDEAAKAFLPEKENIEKAKEVFKSMINEFSLLSQQTSDTWQGADEAIFDMISNLPSEMSAYADLLAQMFEKLKIAAQKGGFEFKAAMQGLQQDFTSGLPNALWSQTYGTMFGPMSEGIREELAQLVTNTQDALSREAQGLDLTDFQESVVKVFRDVASETKGADLNVFEKFIPDLKKSRGEIIKELNALETQYTDTVAAFEKSLAEGVSPMMAEHIHQVTEEQIAWMKANIPALDEAAKRLGELEKKKGRTDNTIEERIKVVDQMNKKYLELNKTLSKAESLQGAFDAYKDAFATAYDREDVRSMSAEDFAKKVLNFPNEDEVVKWLDNLANTVKDKEDKIKVQLAKGKFEMDVDVRLKKESDEILKKEIEDMFDRYDLTLELDKIKAPKGFMKNLFGVDSMSLPMLRAEVESREEDFVGTDMEEDYKKFLEKIDDLERKELEQKAKRFVDYLSKNLDKIENIQRGRGLDLSFARELFDEGKISAELFGEAVQSIVAETNREISKLNLEKFKESPEYIQSMGDMTAYSAKELKELSSKLKDIISKNGQAFSADELKTYHDALERVNKRLERLDRNFIYDKDVYNLKEIKRLNQEIADQKAKEMEINNKLTRQEIYRSGLIVSLENLQKQRDEAKAKGQDTTLLDSLILTTQREIAKANDDVAATQASLKSSKSLLAELGSELKTILGDETEALAKLQAYINLFNKSLNLFTGVFDEVKAVVDSFGVDTDSGVWAGMSVAMEGLSNVGSKASEAVTKFMSGDPIGGTMAAISMVFEAIKGVNKTIDQVQESKIQEQLKQIEDLSDAYDVLEKSIGEAFNAKELADYNAQMATNVDLQLKAYDAAIRAEEAKKNTDPERVRELTKESEALKEEWEDFKKSQLEDMGGVVDFRDATAGFVDAWREAFKETGSGLEGLKDNFKEFFSDIVKQQALTQGATNIMKQLFDEINKSLETDYTISEDEYKNIDDVQSKVLKELDAFLEGYYERYGDLLESSEGGKLSALQKGIQGITEDTAQIIEAYLNSMRGYISEQVTYTKRLYEMFDRMSRGNTYGLNVRMIS